MMRSSCRWFLAAGCWLMACLVAPGAFRIAAAISVSQSVAAAAAAAAAAGTAAAGTSSSDEGSRRSLGGGLFSQSSMQQAATNAAAAAAAAAALAALATGTLSAGMDGSASSPLGPAADEGLRRRRDCVLAALQASLSPQGGPRGAPSPSCPPLGPPSVRCSAASNEQWLRDCLSGQQKQQQHQRQWSVAARPMVPLSPSLQQALEQQLQQGRAYSALHAFKATSQRGLDILRQGALSIMREGGEMAYCTFRAFSAWRSVDQWTPLSAAWRWRLNQAGLIMRRVDAGGGGDCLFHSVALSLLGRGQTVSSHELRRIAADKATGLAACKEGAVLSRAAEEKFLESLEVMAALEAAGEWQDGWSPSQILEAEKLYTATTGFVFDTSTTLGKARAVHYELRIPGNNHWGTASDICALEEELDLGIVVMDDSTGKIYPTACRRKRRSHYAFLYFVGGCHFQLIGLETPQGHKSLFRPEELPAGLLAIYEADTKNDLIAAAPVE